MRQRAGGALLVVAMVLTSQASWAQAPDRGKPTGTAEPSKSAPQAVSPEDVERARKHYERGLELYNEENDEGALVEMQRAYKIAPSYRILYNLARIHRRLNKYALSLREFEGYLREGGAAVPEDRRAEVQKEIALLRSRVGTVDVRVNVPGAEVTIDDVSVGKSPLAAGAVVDPGQRKVSASKPGFAPATRVISVAGGEAPVVELSLQDLTRPAEKPVDPGPRNRAIVAWGVTGVLAGAAVTFGVLALNESDKLKTQKNDFAGSNPDPLQASLDSRASKVKTYALVCDAFAGAAIIGGGVATYFTIRALRGDSEESAPDNAPRAARGPDLTLGPGYIGLHGAF